MRSCYSKSSFNSHPMKNLKIALLLPAAFLFSASFTNAQETLRGRWEASPKDSGLELYFSSRSNDDGGHMSMTETISKSELKGYTSGKDVSFSLVRPAGETAMTGDIENDRGEGTFVFTPSQSYVKSLADEGIS